jgi:hypothetical protein
MHRRHVAVKVNRERGMEMARGYYLAAAEDIAAGWGHKSGLELENKMRGQNWHVDTTSQRVKKALHISLSSKQGMNILLSSTCTGKFSLLKCPPAKIHLSNVQQLKPTAYSFGWWLMAGADLFWEKSTVGWLLVAGLFWEKSTGGW